jgi:CBS domain-containing protein
MTKDLVSVTSDALLTEAAKQMRDHSVGDVLVTDANGRLRGILTDRDIVVRALAEGKRPEETTCGAICSDEITTLAPKDDSDRAVVLMRTKGVRRLPVIDDGGKAVGILTLGDLARTRDPRSVLGRISAAPPTA